MLALGSVSKDPTLGARVVIIGAEGWGKQQEIFVSGPITEIQQRAVARMQEALVS